MDNLCHTLTGWTIARAGIGRLSPWATATCIIGANLPDLDIIVALQGELHYLEHHRGITHSAVGLAVQSVLLAAVVRGFKWIKTRNRFSIDQANFKGLLLASAAGLLSHLLLDWTNSYGVRPWLPFARDWYYGDLVFVVDPWLWLLFGAALFLGGAKTLANSKGWLALFAILAATVGAASFWLVPDQLGFAPWLWFVLLFMILAAKKWKFNWSKTTLARSALVGYLLYLTILGTFHWRAIALAGRISSSIEPARIEKIDANPLPMRPDRWTLFVQTSDRILKTQTDLNNFDSEVTAIDRGLEDPAAKAALATCPGKLAEHFGRYLRAEIKRNEALWKVDLIDERFPRQNDRRSIGQITIWLNSDLTAMPDERICPEL